MTLDELTQLIVDEIDDRKGKDILVLDTHELSDQFERVIIASGTSNRQTRAIAYSVSGAVKKAGGDVLGVEGGDSGEWVLVDCGNIVCHFLQPDVRQYYNLEELWAGKELHFEPTPPEHLVQHAPH